MEGGCSLGSSSWTNAHKTQHAKHDSESLPDMPMNLRWHTQQGDGMLLLLQ